MCIEQIASVKLYNPYTNTTTEISYSIIKNTNYGIQITKRINNSILRKNRINFKDISSDKNILIKIIDNLITSSNDINQLQYVLEDTFSHSA